MALGATMAFFLFPTAMLLGFHSHWDNVNGDVATGLVGFYEFAQDRWRWPLLYTLNLDAPTGTTIFFTDPNGILAVVGKLFFKTTGILYPYMGIWILASYMLNAGFGYLILKHLGVSILAAVAGSCLFFLLPAFIYRFGHHTLAGQFVIVATIYAYLRITKGVNNSEIYAWAFAVGTLVFVTPYLFAMCAALFLAALIDGYRRSNVTLYQAAIGFVVLIATAAFFVRAAGLGSGGLPKAGGFTDWSMNLLSPIWPQFSILLPNETILKGTPGQYEGFNYLGMGVLSLAMIALATGYRQFSCTIRGRPTLAIALGGMAIYSLSSVVYAGQVKLVSLHYETLPVLSEITGVFRVPGRFFWPFGYVLVALSITIIARKMSPAVFLAVLSSAVLIQFVEIAPLYNHVRARAALEEPAKDKDLVAPIIPNYTEVRIFPGFLCTNGGDRRAILTFQMVAALHGLPVNGAYVNRGGMGCAEHQKAVLADPFAGASTSNPLLIIFRKSAGEEMSAKLIGADIQCSAAPTVYLCARDKAPPIKTPRT
ncbi:hypothetical protein DUT91_13615 [Phyllobacterium salinisoli]|uniref:Glycosyltransferase RgtA/B/C/D-like domain-containing protein n=1 Tax=Phyllobacterium salinisoli TaxID=1899321 RepID=A0A368K3X1_9HYPH|nr:DUF6311 domain-containing protein [Phyllobacterium salinisoli]RCS23325.1 hypothetical protein DUT91_13615 [Phyllobacterium salinisoli]